MRKIKNYNITAELKKAVAQLKEEARQASKREAPLPADETLCDNLYLLEQFAHGALKALKDAPKLCLNGCGKTVLDACGELFEKDTSFSQQTAQEVLCKYSLNFMQFEFLPSFLCAYLIIKSARAVKEQDNAALKKSVAGLRKIDELDYDSIIAHCCNLEKILCTEKSGIYPNMTAATKADYRRAIYKTAQRQGIETETLAKKLVEKANELGCHIGELIDFKEPKLRRTLLLLFEIITPAAVSCAVGFGINRPYFAFLLFLPMWEVFRPLIERIFLYKAPKRILPQTEIDSIPDNAKTAVVVSTLLPNAENSRVLYDKLKQHYRTSGEKNVCFVILADMRASKAQTMPKDSTDIKSAKKEIDRLNKEFGSHFMLAVRKRILSKTQNSYIGRERKRGAITQLIRAINGQENDFICFCGETEEVKKSKYIFALDWDTELTPDSVRETVGAAIHPLNKPKIENGRVVKGYGIIAPSVSISLESTQKTRFAQSVAGNAGMSAYDSNLTDLYFTLFGESIFTGKGLIDVSAFYRTLNDALPEEKILSHDSIESGFLRTAFCPNAQILDAFPENQTAFFARLRRWVRGDTQNLIYLLLRVNSKKNPLNALTKYKLFDNIRRSLTPIFSLVLIALSPFVPYAKAVFVLTAVLSCMSGYVLGLFSVLFGGVKALFSPHLTANLRPEIAELTLRAFTSLVMLPRTAFACLGAILKSLWRMVVSKKNLLQWTTSADVNSKQSIPREIIRQLPCILYCLFLFGTLSPSAIVLAAVFLLNIPYCIVSGKQKKEKNKLGEEQRKTLTSYAAAHWQYYERFCNAQSNWLPPDNIQETPYFKIAARTSPTNIGMYMLCTLAALDFGFISLDEVIRRVSLAISTIDKLEKYRGHLLNWYDLNTLQTLTPKFVSSVDSGNFICSTVALRQGLTDYSKKNIKIKEIINRLDEIIEKTDFSFLYNKRKNLFHIGFDVEKGQLSDSYYDLIMSEARMTGYYAVASGEAPTKHWQALSRAVAKCKNRSGAVSWGGTMFEYFMPHILLPVYKNSLFDKALDYSLFCQQQRVKRRGIPWGISESAFYAFDMDMNYLYKAHGVQKTGLKRDLNNETVISPYSTFLALPTAPEQAFENLKELEALGMSGKFGFYEAIDFTPSRLENRNYAIIKSYMAHHIGMSLLSMANAVFGNIMQKRFMSDNRAASAKVLLQEKPPVRCVIDEPYTAPAFEAENSLGSADLRVFENPNILSPQARLLSNGEWSCCICDNGASFSKYGRYDIHRADSDLFFNPQGIFAFVETDGFTLPVAKCTDNGSGAEFSACVTCDGFTLKSQKDNLKCKMDIKILRSSPCELRSVTVENVGDKECAARILFYFEPNIDVAESELSHPSFSHLLLRTSFDEKHKTTLFERAFSSGETLALGASIIDDIGFDYSFRRDEILERFIGIKSLLRGNIAFDSNPTFIDSCCAFAVPLTIKAGQKRTVTLAVACDKTCQAATEQIAMAKNDFFKGKTHFAPFVFDETCINGIIANKALPHLFWLPHIANEYSQCIEITSPKQSDLWATGISGDNPLMLIEVHNSEDVYRAVPYILLNRAMGKLGIKTDIAVCASNDAEQVLGSLHALLKKYEYEHSLNENGGVHPVDKTKYSPEQINSLISFANYIAPKSAERPILPLPDFNEISVEPCEADDSIGFDGLKVENGVFANGSFCIDNTPKKPWCNVICNRQFGTLVSDGSLGYTWCFNSSLGKITRWYNDVITDNRGERLLVKIDDKVYDTVWGSKAVFYDNKAEYYGKIKGIKTKVEVTVDPKSLAKRVKIAMNNDSNIHIPVKAVYYTEPILGTRQKHSRFVRSYFNGTGITCFSDFSQDSKGFMSLSCKGGADFFTVDKPAFLQGDWNSPNTLPSERCAAVGKEIKLPARRTEQIEFVLSFAHTRNSAEKMSKIVNKVQKRNNLAVSTPDKAFNNMVNTWLPVQIKNSRIFGRTGFYQCGGAYGFRDQLQDVLSLILLEPDLAKAHIIRCCANQFEQGDVLHWWHITENSGAVKKGVRTRYNDDYLWLPFAVAEYVKATGDNSFLNIEVAYSSAEELKENEKERYLTPQKSKTKASVYEHCKKAIERSLNFGKHGLPLFNGGDWCDGYNKVGEKGNGESVWLAQFLTLVLTKFGEAAALKGDTGFEEKCSRTAAELRQAVINEGWDGQWFLRGYYDDGTRLGSNSSKYCKIDLLPQAFSALCSLPDEKVNSALDFAIDKLVDEKHGLIKLLTPAFPPQDSKTGYISLYPQGVRENGGQYTHAAVWLCLALLKAGRVDEAYGYLKMLNPINKYTDPETAEAYRTEPYSLAGDIYANEENIGTGGWTQYSGSAGWYYRCAVEEILGIKQRNGKIYLEPKLPDSWLGYTARLETDGYVTDIKVERGEERLLLVDGEKSDFIPKGGKNRFVTLTV